VKCHLLYLLDDENLPRQPAGQQNRLMSRDHR
jgi:hypothetical protein